MGESLVLSEKSRQELIKYTTKPIQNYELVEDAETRDMFSCSDIKFSEKYTNFIKLVQDNPDAEIVYHEYNKVVKNTNEVSTLYKKRKF